MRCFVTGATGFIGSRVARQLAEAGHSVVALVRDPARAGELAAAGIEICRGDITRREELRAPMEGADCVLHLAAWYKVGAGSRARARARQINVEGTRNVLELMRDLGVPRGVYTSSLAVNSDTRGRLVDETHRFRGRHLSLYDQTKWEAHYEVALPMAAAGLPLVIVLPGAVYGPGDSSLVGDALRRFLTRRLPLIPRRTALCWGHVEDTARAHLLALERGRPGESYIVAGPPHTLEEVFTLAASLTGIKPPRLKAPPAVLRTLSALARPFSFLPWPAAFHPESLRVSAGTTYVGSNARAARELGLVMRPLREGLAETLAWEQERLQV